MSGTMKSALAGVIEAEIAKQADGGKTEERSFPYIVTLKSPITVDGQKHEKITFREPKGRDWTRAEKSGKSDIEKRLNLLCDLSELQPEVFEELGYQDHIRCLEVANDFFGDYRMAMLDPMSLLSSM